MTIDNVQSKESTSISQEIEVYKKYEKFIFKLTHDIRTTNSVSKEDLFQEGVITLLQFYRANSELFNSDQNSFYLMFRSRLKNKFIDIGRMENHRVSMSFEVLNERKVGTGEDPFCMEVYESEDPSTLDPRIATLFAGCDRGAFFQSKVHLGQVMDLAKITLSELAYKILDLVVSGSSDLEKSWKQYIELGAYKRTPKQYTPQFLVQFFGTSYASLSAAISEIIEFKTRT